MFITLTLCICDRYHGFKQFIFQNDANMNIKNTLLWRIYIVNLSILSCFCRPNKITIRWESFVTFQGVNVKYSVFFLY